MECEYYHTEGDLEIESDVNQNIIEDMINDQDGDDYWDEGKTEVNFVGELDDLGYMKLKKDIFDPQIILVILIFTI